MVSYTAEISRLSIKGQVVNILGFAGHAVFFYHIYLFIHPFIYLAVAKSLLWHTGSLIFSCGM